MAAVWSFFWLGHCSDFDCSDMMMDWACFCLESSWSQTDLLCWCSMRLFIFIKKTPTPKWWCQDRSQMSWPACLFVTDSALCPYPYCCTNAFSPPALYSCASPPPIRRPSRSQASLRNAYAPLASHGFMLWGQNVLTPGPSLFTASLLAGFFFWRRQLQSEKSSHWGGTVYSLGLGGKPLIQSCPICSVFWIGIWMGLEIEGGPYDTLK